MKKLIDEESTDIDTSRALQFVHTFDAFKTVVDKTFGERLHEGSSKAIEHFRDAYLALGISVTPKVHLVFDHVFPECEKCGHGLKYLSEHAFESLHRDFLKHLERHLVKDRDNPNFVEKLKKCVCEYNSSHT